MSTAMARACLLTLSIVASTGCYADIGTVGQSSARGAAGEGGAGTADDAGSAGAAASTADAGDEPDESDEGDDDESDDEVAVDERCATLELELLGVAYPPSLCAACDAATPCTDGLECKDAQCRECVEDDECDDDGHCEHGVCISEDAEEAEP